MQQLLLETQNITSFLEELARYAADTVGPGLACGITMDRDGSRSIIDQAIGIIMGQNRCPATDAFEIRRAASNHHNIKLRDVANEIVTRISGTPPHPTPPPD